MDLTTRTRILGTDCRLERIKDKIKTYTDFPKAGVIFRDILPLFRDNQVITDLICLLEERVHHTRMKVDAVVGVEARGFLLAPLLAQSIGKPFIPVRKAGKLPGETHKITYDLEYGTESLEIQDGAVKGLHCIIIDDLLASGGTLKAAGQLVEKAGGKVGECMVVVELRELQGRKNLNWEVFSLIQL